MSDSDVSKMSEPRDFEFDTEFTDLPTCPSCGHAHKDAWEWNLGGGVGLEGDGERECESCDAPMFVSRHVSISYSAHPVEKPPLSQPYAKCCGMNIFTSRMEGGFCSNCGKPLAPLTSLK